MFWTKFGALSQPKVAARSGHLERVVLGAGDRSDPRHAAAEDDVAVGYRGRRNDGAFGRELLQHFAGGGVEGLKRGALADESDSVGHGDRTERGAVHLAFP